MIKKIPVERLRPGMFLHNLNAGWMAHSFIRSRFLVVDDETVQVIIRAGIREVYIDSARGLDDADAPTEAEVNAQLMYEMQAAVEAQVPYRCTTVAEELANARRLRTQASRVIRTVFHDVRQNKPIDMAALEGLVSEIVESVLRNDGALLLFLRTRTAADQYLVHSVAVCTLIVTCCHAQNEDPLILRQAGLGGLLHDIGKTQVPSAVVNKPGRFHPAELVQMQQHPALGLALLQRQEGCHPIVQDIILNHHERLDGSGYPGGVRAEELSPMARLAAIADVYDDMITERSYQTALPPTAALKKMWEWSKYHFDPELMRCFMTAVGIYPVGSLVRLESGRVAVVVEPHDSEVLKPKVRAFFSTGANVHIPSQLVDLSRPFGKGGGDRIVGYEDPRKWNLDPLHYLTHAP